MKKLFFALIMGAAVFLTACGDSDSVRYEAQNVISGELVRFDDNEGKKFPFDTGRVVIIEKDLEINRWEVFTDAKLPSESTKRKFAKVKILRVIGPHAEKPKKPNYAAVDTEKSIFE